MSADTESEAQAPQTGRGRASARGGGGEGTSTDGRPDVTESQPSGAKERRLPLLARLILALLAGLALAAAFPPFGYAWLAPLAPAVLTWLILDAGRARRGALVGFVFGLGFFGLLLKWLALTGADGWAAVVVIESAFLAVYGACATLVIRHRLWPFWVSALWLAIEYARAHLPFGGLPWGRVAGALDDTPMAALSSLGGVPFVSFVAVFAGNLLLWAVVRRRRGRRRLIAVAVAVGLALGGAFIPLPSYEDKTPNGSDTVAIIQGNVPGKGIDSLGVARTVTRNHLRATEQLMADVERGRYDQPDWVLWPENATDIDPTNDPLTRETVQGAADVAGVPILVGAILDGPVRPDLYRQTAGIVWDPDTGPGQTYAKRHPVPFGEYIPFRELLLPYIDRLQMVGRDTYPGDRAGNMTIAGTHVGLVICFEIAYDEVVADVARDSRNSMLVVQSNNATWQGLGMADQQFAITKMRAIEYGKAALVATPSGISGVIGPDGEVIHKSGESVRDIYVTDVPHRTTRTLAAILGPIPELLLVLAGIAVAVAAVGSRVRPRIRRRRSA